jgi:hypothetical protein
MTIVKVFGAQFCLFLGGLVWLYWHFVISQPPPGLIPEQNPIGYLNHLGSNLNAMVPIALSGVTFWSLLSLLFTLAGQKTVAMFIDWMVKAKKT